MDERDYKAMNAELKNQTAVEFLVDKWVRQGTLYSSDCKQALELEKQQIIDAYHVNPLETKYGNIGEQYYQETYKK
jgi:hypothetical protein